MELDKIVKRISG